MATRNFGTGTAQLKFMHCILNTDLVCKCVRITALVIQFPKHRPLPQRIFYRRCFIVLWLIKQTTSSKLGHPNRNLKRLRAVTGRYYLLLFLWYSYFLRPAISLSDDYLLLLFYTTTCEPNSNGHSCVSCMPPRHFHSKIKNCSRRSSHIQFASQTFWWSVVTTGYTWCNHNEHYIQQRLIHIHWLSDH